MKSAIIAGALLLGLALPVLAARGIGGFTYDVSAPTGETADFADKLSLRGFGMEAKWFRGEHTAVGFTWHWNVFHRQLNGTCEVENGHVTGHQFHRIYASPILVAYYYHWGDIRYGRGTMYYGGMGGGAYWVERRLEVGTGAHQWTTWHMGLCPEVGLYHGLSFGAYLNVSARYNYAFKSGDAPSQSYFCFCLGVAWAK